MSLRDGSCDGSAARLRTSKGPAIASERLIQFRYDESPRVTEPHDYGIQHGSTRLFLAYQLRGPVRPGKKVVGWRNFDVSGMDDCVVLERRFRAAAVDSTSNT